MGLILAAGRSLTDSPYFSSSHGYGKFQVGSTRPPQPKRVEPDKLNIFNDHVGIFDTIHLAYQFWETNCRNIFIISIKYDGVNKILLLKMKEKKQTGQDVV
jgi:hypothetical protein